MVYNWLKFRDTDTVKREVREGFGDLIQFLGDFTVTTDSHSQNDSHRFTFFLFAADALDHFVAIELKSALTGFEGSSF